MVDLPLDPAKFDGIVCATNPAPRTVRETGQPKVDQATGMPLFQVGLCLMRNGKADVVTVSVPGEPKGVVQGMPVRLDGFEASPWEFNGRSGIAYRAAALAPLAPAAGKAVAQ